MRTCTVPGCGRKHRAKGLCDMHYQRLMKTGSVELGGRWKVYPQLPRIRYAHCTVPGCTKKHEAKGKCHNHYLQEYRAAHGRKS